MSVQLSQFLQTGDQSAVYVEVGSGTSASWAEIDLAENVSLNTDHDQKEVKPRRSTRGGVKSNLIGLNDFSGSMTSYVPAAEAEEEMMQAYLVLREASVKRKPVKMLFVDGGLITSTTPIRATRAVCGVGKNREESGDDPTKETYNFHFVPNDFQSFPEEGTVQNGEFTPDAGE